jgi:hypothetical protein
VAHCSNSNCTSATISPVDSTAWVGRYTSITIGADGLPIISYEDTVNHNLKVAHCSDAACSSAATISTLDHVGTMTYPDPATSIIVGPGMLPIIAYFDETNMALKVAHCSNFLCSPYIKWK